MKTALQFCVAVSLAVTALGCSNQPQQQAGDPAASGPPQQTPPAGQAAFPLPADTPPDHIVSSFLHAMRDGDQTVAAGLLTHKARQETAKHDLTVQPPGAPTAQFEVGGAEYLDASQLAAHVNSRWTETDPHGHTTSYEIVWALRRQDDGWRIAGMATQLVENHAPVFLNFEDPDDMLNKWQEADQLARQQQEAAEAVRQAQIPDPGTARR